MIGNDIVDLYQIRKTTNWNRKRFLSKVFTEQERIYIRNSDDQHQMVWRLWSMKEAAYKAFTREFESRFFNPKTMDCRLMGSSVGKVTINNLTFHTLSHTTMDYVYTEAHFKKHITSYSSIFENSKGKSIQDKSSFGYNRLIQHLSKVKHLNPENLRVVKSDLGIPKMINGTSELPLQFSITHCGRFGAFSILDL